MRQQFVEREGCDTDFSDGHGRDTIAIKVDDLLALDLQDRLDEMAKLGWEMVSTEQLINEHSPATPQRVFFWCKSGED